MWETILPAEMKALEQNFMAQTGVPGAVLMEMAAHAVVEAVERCVPRTARVLFLCGPGNNGGDGYAAARLWRMGGGEALVWELDAPVTPDAQMNRTLLCMQGVTPTLPCEKLPEGCGCVVDALFGTGLTRPLTGAAEALAHLCNASGLPLVAVDIPSGLNGTTGETALALHATETVTFHRVKQGLVMGEGPAYTGRLTVASIGIPTAWGSVQGMRILTAADAARLCVPRPRLSHKGTFGRVVLVVGSEGMAGAAALCAEACMRMGAGLTQIACREHLVPIMQVLVPCATCIPLPERDGILTAEAPERLMQAMQAADAAAVGCGLGQQADVLPLLHVLLNAACPVIWDADALNLLAHEHLSAASPQSILTPHPGEAARLLGWSIAQVTAKPLEVLTALQRKLGGAALLKGTTTLMTDGQHLAANITGSPALAQGGSGDVLTGMLAALFAQQKRLDVDTLTLMQLGVYLHGYAGQKAEAVCGPTAATARDVVEALRGLWEEQRS